MYSYHALTLLAEARRADMLREAQPPSSPGGAQARADGLDPCHGTMARTPASVSDRAAGEDRAEYLAHAGDDIAARRVALAEAVEAEDTHVRER